MSKNKIVKYTVVIIIVIALVLIGKYLMEVSSYKNKVESITYSDLDIESLEDGTYIGEYDVSLIKAKVSVKIKNGKIKSIELLEHYNDHGERAEKIIDDIIDEQKVKVDTITGATNSSSVIKKAVDNALIKANSDSN